MASFAEPAIEPAAALVASAAAAPESDSPRLRELFGGAMACSRPAGWQDVSDLVPVPDNQEARGGATDLCFRGWRAGPLADRYAEVFRLALPPPTARAPRVASLVVELLEARCVAARGHSVSLSQASCASHPVRLQALYAMRVVR
jgi:hypothetical protein